MDFFGAQDRARRTTWRLVALFAAAVVALIVATNLLIAVVARFTTTQGLADGLDGALYGTSTETWLGISALVAFTIAAASLYKYLKLRSGGRAVADLLGARQIDPGTRALAERRLLNVVEEMAIASGIPVPPVYVLEEPGINAFAAGLGTSDAIVGVTRGTLEHLDRDELQGVIGHEFSHILNGDMRINLRLVAILHGILFLGLLGEMLLRARSHGGRSRDALPLVLLGVGLVVIGFGGTFFGNLIKAALNRQREFLADAAAVQFTRNPGGIADALKKIGGSAVGSRIEARHSKELSHLFFGQAVSFVVRGLFATHPPLERRIRALEPSWDGRFTATGAAVASSLPDAAATLASDPVQAVVAQVGNPEPANVEVARKRIAELSEPLIEAVREPASAFTLVQALFFSPDATIRDRQVLALARVQDADATHRAASAFPHIADRDAIERMTLITLAAPTLKTLSKAQYRQLVTAVEALVKADSRIDLTEWVLHRILVGELAPHFGTRPQTRVHHRTEAAEEAAVATVLSAIACAAHCDTETRARAFAAGTAALGRPLVLDTRDDPNFARLNEALRVLRTIAPLRKPRVIKACTACALVDGASVVERALLAGLAATLDCPLPPDFRIGPR